MYDGTGQALAGSAVGNPYLFTGCEYDGETTFYNYRHRYLDPRQGRFVTRDPLGLWGDPGNWGNAYAYCGNDPWTFTDPLGLAGGRGFPVLDDGHIPSTAGGNTHRNIAQAASELPNFVGLQPGQALVAGATGIPLPYVENNLTSNVHDTAEAVGFFAGMSSFLKGGAAVCRKAGQKLLSLPEFLTGLWRATDDVADVTGAARAASEGAAAMAVDASAESVNSGRLVYDVSSESWLSRAGLIYGRGSSQGNRVLHVMEHLTPNPSKPLHTPFNVHRTQLIGLIDEAWIARQGTGMLQANGNRIFDVSLGRVIGINGETSIRIIVRDGTTRLITAYPIR